MATANENLFWLMAEAWRRAPERDALRLPDTGTSLSFGDLDRESARLNARLKALGVEPGDRVLVQVDKSPQAVALYLACLRRGAIFVPINTAYTEAEVDYFVGDAEPRLFVCRAADADSAAARHKGVTVRGLDDAGGGSLLEDLDAEGLFEIAARRGEDLAAILYTSGTTGRSKGAMLTHHNLAVSAVMLVDYWGWQDEDVLLHALPIFHVHGLFVALHCALLTATPMIFLPAFQAARVVSLLSQATVLMGVPTFYTRMLNEPALNTEQCASMRLFISGSAPLTEQTFEAWTARTGHHILERYGMSETMMNTSNPLLGERVPGTVGFALPGVEVRVRDDEGTPVPAGSVGVLEVRGPNVFAGYWRMPEKTATEFREDGFFITGDLAAMAADGRVTLVGRARDLVISGGYNVYPKEVERLLDAMPEVQESAVIGVPHADFGEAVVAVVVPADGPVSQAAVDAALRDELARFKQPKRVLNEAALPRNAMGKVQKKALRERYGRLFEEES